MATYYINADSGNDTTGDGSSSLPWLTLSKAITGSVANDTIILQDATATYAFTLQVITDRTIQGTTRDSCVFSGTGSGSYIWGLNGTVNVSNVVFTGVTSMANGTVSTVSSVFRVNSTATLSFTNCTFRDMVLPGSTNSIRNGNGLFGTLKGLNTTFTNTITSCNFYNLTSNVTAVGANLFTFYAFSGVFITANYVLNNNTFYLNAVGTAKLNSIFWIYDVSTGSILNMTLRNNIISNVSGETLPLEGANITNTLNDDSDYNDYFNLTTTTVTLGANDITSDPLMIDPINDNFELRPTSPALGTGTIV